MYPCCIPPPLALLLRHPLPSLLLLSCLFRGMWLTGSFRWPDSKSVTHSLSNSPFFTWLRTPPAASPGQAECVFTPHGYTQSLSPLLVQRVSVHSLFSVSSQASPCPDLFQCVVASRVCVRLRPCPVKYRLFKEVSNIIWPLYCNYKVLLLEIAHRERAAHRHLLSSSPRANAISCYASADALASVSKIFEVSLACIDPDVATTGVSISWVLVTL